MSSFDRAIAVLQSMAALFKKLEQQHNIDSAYLHTIVILLYSGAAEKANNQLQEFMK
jgi:hypothetical protein